MPIEKYDIEENSSKCLEFLVIKSALNDERSKRSRDLLDILARCQTDNPFVAPKEVVESIGSISTKHIQLFNAKVVHMLDPLIVLSRRKINEYGDQEMLLRCMNYLFGHILSAIPSLLFNGALAYKNIVDRPEDDFDPFGYLIGNLDLCFKEVDPYSHYKDYGINEGRTFTPSLVTDLVKKIIEDT